MSDCDCDCDPPVEERAAATEELEPEPEPGPGPGPGPDPDPGPGPGPGRPPLAEKALSEAFARLRYRDTSLLVWTQQQQDLTAPASYLSRSQSAWYSRYGNQAVLVRDKTGLEEEEGRSRICSLM